MKRLFRLGFHLNEIQVWRNIYKKHVEWKDEGYPPISFRELINESNIRHAMLNGIDDDQCTGFRDEYLFLDDKWKARRVKLHEKM